MALLIAIVAVVGPLVGFLAGYTLFKRSLMWCPECGHRLRCLDCLRVAQAVGRPVPL